MNRRLFPVLLCLLLSVGGLFVSVGYSASSSKDAILDLLPADTLICFRLNHFTGTLEKLDQYLSGVSPMPVSMMFPMFLGGALGDPMLNGVDKNGTIAAALFLNSTGGEPMAVLLLPVPDAKVYTSSSYSRGADENGIYTLSAPGSSLGTVAFVPLEGIPYLMLGPAEQKQSLLAVRTILKEKKQSLAARLNPADAQNAVSAPAWFWLNVDKGYQTAAGPLKEAVQQGLQAASQGGAVMPFKPEAISTMLNTLDTWMGQADSLSILLSPVPEQMTAEVLFTAKKDTELAKMLVRDPAMKPGFSLGGYLDAEAPVHVLAVLNKPMIEKVNWIFLDAFLSLAGDKQAALRSQTEALLAKSMKATGAQMAYSYGYTAGTPPFSARQAIEITDAAAMREVVKEGKDLANEFYKMFGIPAVFTMEEKADQYKGVSIDQIVVRVSVPENASEQDRKMLKTMFGDDEIYLMALADKKLFMAMGPQARQSLERMIDLPANAPAPAEMQAALKAVPNAQTADAVVSVNVIRLMKGFGEMTRSTQAVSSDAPMPPFFEIIESIPVQTQSALAIGVRADGGRIQTHLVLPKQHLMEIMSWTMQIQQRMMIRQFQQNQSSTTPASSAAPVGNPL
ncbi:MAG: hypothetical protein WHS88_09910 [Anaerohalosphaeraceae bacterium]